MNNKFIYLDVETTGLDTNSDGLIKFYSEKSDGSFLDLKINPEKPSSPEAISKHGVSDEVAKTFQTLDKFKVEIEEFYKDSDYIIVGQNLKRFDLPILQSNFDRYGIEVNLYEFSTQDTMEIEKQLTPMNLGDIYKRYFNEDINDYHDAKSDVKATRRIHEEQLKNPNLKLESLPKTYDFEGKFVFNDIGLPVWNFGKHKGKWIFRDLDYLKWYLSQDGVPHSLAKKMREDYAKLPKEL